MANLPVQKTNIIDLLDIESIPINEKAEILETAINLVEMRILERILDELNEEEIEKFQNLLDGKDDDKVYEFLKEKNLDVIEMGEEETKGVRQDILEVAQEI